MSQSAITIAFEDYLTQQVASGGTVTLDQFIFANVPDLDPNTPIDRSEQIPVDYIVYQQAVTLPGVINNNEVVYSVTMGTEVGDFDFNWIGLVNSATSLLGMVTHAPAQQKFKNADGQQGNTLTRSFLMEFDGAATATAITTPAETWQIDFTARLAGMDDRQRLENMDIYGYGAFFGDGYLVWGNPTDGYTIDAGVGYVDGLRVQLNADQSLNVTAKPINVYVDACWKGTLTSVWNVQQQITLASDLSNYTDPDGTAHYVFAVASIDVNGAVTDLRPSGSKDNQALSGYLQTKNNLAEIAAAGAEAQEEARDNLALGTSATLDATTSTTDNTVGRVLKVGDFGISQAISVPDGVDLAEFFKTAKGAFYRCGSPTGFINAPSWFNAWFDVTLVAHQDNYRTLSAIDSLGHSALAVIANGAFSGWIKPYSETQKPTVADIGAVPQYSNVLTVDLNTLNGTKPGRYYQSMSANATAAYHYPVSTAGSLDVIPNGVGSGDPADDQNRGCTQEYRPYNNSVLYRRTYSVSAGVWSWSGWAEEYSTVNPPPATDLSAYETISDANARFVQDVQLGAQSSMENPTKQWNYTPAGTVMNGLYQNNASGNDWIANIAYKPLQKKINGAWVTITG